MWEDIRTFAPAKAQLPFGMELCGISYCDGSYSIYRKCSPVWVAEYIVEGTGTVIVDGERHTASEGDVYLLPACHEHYYFSDSLHPWTKFFFNAYGTVVQSLAENYGLTSMVVFKNCPIETQFRKLIAITDQEASSDEILSQLILQIHRIFIELHHHSIQEENVPAEAYELKEFIDNKISGQLMMNDLTETFHRSEDYIIKLFKNTYRQTPYAYYLDRKLELAKTLLSNTNMPICQISSYLGFEDPHYFSNRFHRFTQQSPTNFRKYHMRHDNP